MFACESDECFLLRSETQSDLEGELGRQIGMEVDFGSVVVFAQLQHLGVGGAERVLGLATGFEDPDSTAIMAIDDAVLLLEMTRDGGVVLDDFAVEVADGDVALRRVREADGMEPRVA